MDLEYALAYRELYENHWWWRARENLIVSVVERICTAGIGGPILDVGCGDGLLFGRLAKFGDVEGVEANAAVVTADNPWKDRIYLSSFDETFQPEKAYSIILMLDVLEHFPDAITRLQKAAELLSQGGRLILTVPAFPCLWSSHDDLNRHFARFTKKTLVALTSSAGLQNLSCQYVFHWIFAIKLLLHFKEQWLGAHPQVPRVPRPFINRLLYSLSVSEQRLFSYWPLPFGSSLLAICGKQ